MKQQQEQMCNCRHTEDKRAKISSMSILVNTGRTSSPFFSALDKFIHIHISKAPTWLGILWAFCDLRGLYSHWRLRFHSRAYRLHTIFVMKLLNFLSGQYQVQEMDICPPFLHHQGSHCTPASAAQSVSQLFMPTSNLTGSVRSKKFTIRQMFESKLSSLPVRFCRVKYAQLYVGLKSFFWFCLWFIDCKSTAPAVLVLNYLINIKFSF